MNGLKIISVIVFIYAQADDEFNEIMDYFVGKPVKIFFSAFSHYHLVKIEREISTPFAGISKFLGAEEYKYNDRSEIHRNDDKFMLEVGGSMLCQKKNTIVKCADDDKGKNWTIERKEFGFAISRDNKCITKKVKDVLELETCLYGNEQIFDFKLIIDKNKCDNINEENDEKLNPINEMNAQPSSLRDESKVNNSNPQEEIKLGTPKHLNYQIVDVEKGEFSLLNEQRDKTKEKDPVNQAVSSRPIIKDVKNPIESSKGSNFFDPDIEETPLSDSRKPESNVNQVKPMQDTGMSQDNPMQETGMSQAKPQETPIPKQKTPLDDQIDNETSGNKNENKYGYVPKDTNKNPDIPEQVLNTKIRSSG